MKSRKEFTVSAQMMTTLCLDDFDYFLPPERIAQTPLADRTASRLLELNGNQLNDRAFSELPGLLKTGDLLVINDTKVIHARLYGTKASGGKVEVLVERPSASDDQTQVLAQVRASKTPKIGSWLRLEDAFDVQVVGRAGEFFELKFPGNALELVEQHGRLPLPPYIDRDAVATDEARYQTVYAREKGSVAAPTAGLHFDADTLDSLRSVGVGISHVTLHVGAGTFQPVRVHELKEHVMHTERYEVPLDTVKAIAATKARGGRVVAVGTTSLRALESAASSGELRAGSGSTALFVTPGFKFRVVDLLITNFHLPKSTLLMLVSAFAGFDEIRLGYAHAIAAEYRFFSYGDAMLLHRKTQR
jgi:S-adenosylmethionine:tRNA ribosyltransferase-isomerase